MKRAERAQCLKNRCAPARSRLPAPRFLPTQHLEIVDACFVVEYIHSLQFASNLHWWAWRSQDIYTCDFLYPDLCKNMVAPDSFLHLARPLGPAAVGSQPTTAPLNVIIQPQVAVLTQNQSINILTDCQGRLFHSRPLPPAQRRPRTCDWYSPRCT